MTSVREARERAGLTQAEVAARSGVAQPNIAAYETGRRTASPAMIERLMRAIEPRPSQQVQAHRDELLRIAEEQGFTDVRIFGSAARHADTHASDVDLLVHAPDGAGLMALATLALDLKELLGVEVDLVSEAGLAPDHPIRRQAVPL